VKPEVLAWALLFVVGVGLAYRFFSWLRRRSKPMGRVHHVPMPPHPETSAALSDPITEARKPEAAATPLSPRPVNVHPATTPPMSVPPASFAAAPVQAADVRATLAPRPDIAAVPPSHSPAPLSLPITEAHADDVPPTQREHITIRKRGTWLRARKIGREIPSLNVRIKDTRGPRTRSTCVTRKPTAFSDRRAKSLAAPKGLEKAPPRRIGIKRENGNPLASTKTATKIVGAPRRSPRVRFAAAR
jgi:hypothetical protein